MATKLMDGTRTSSPFMLAPSMGTKDTFLPNMPVVTATHSGRLVSSSRYTASTLPILL